MLFVPYFLKSNHLIAVDLEGRRIPGATKAKNTILYAGIHYAIQWDLLLNKQDTTFILIYMVLCNYICILLFHPTKCNHVHQIKK